MEWRMNIMKYVSDVLLSNSRQSQDWSKYLNITPRDEGSTASDDVMVTPARGKKMGKGIPGEFQGDLEALTGRTRPRIRTNPAWAEGQGAPDSFVSRLRGRGLGGGRHVQDFSPWVNEKTKERGFDPMEGDDISEPLMGIYEDGGYSALRGGDIDPSDMKQMEKQWKQEKAKRESDLKDLSQRWNKNIVDWSQSLMEGPQRGLMLNQFFNNARAAILGKNESAEDALKMTHDIGSDITGSSILDIVNRKIQILDEQIDRFSQEDDELAPLFDMQEDDFAKLLDEMRNISPTGISPQWADKMSLLTGGEMFDREIPEGVGLPPSWDALRGAYDETRGKGGGGRPRTKFTGQDLLSREPFESISADPGASMQIKDFFRNLDTSQGLTTESGKGLLRSQSSQRLASIKQERAGLEAIRSSIIEVLRTHEYLMGMQMTADKLKTMPELLQNMDDSMMKMLNAVAVTYNDPERLVAKGAEGEDPRAARRLNLTYKVDDASNMLIMTKVLYLAKAWNAFRQTMEVGSFEDMMQQMPVEQDFDEQKERINQGPTIGGGDVISAVSQKFLRFAAIADAKGFHKIADRLDSFIIG